MFQVIHKKIVYIFNSFVYLTETHTLFFRIKNFVRSRSPTPNTQCYAIAYKLPLTFVALCSLVLRSSDHRPNTVCCCCCCFGFTWNNFFRVCRLCCPIRYWFSRCALATVTVAVFLSLYSRSSRAHHNHLHQTNICIYVRERMSVYVCVCLSF